jgi:hypothetical protein
MLWGKWGYAMPSASCRRVPETSQRSAWEESKRFVHSLDHVTAVQVSFDPHANGLRLGFIEHSFWLHVRASLGPLSLLHSLPQQCIVMLTWEVAIRRNIPCDSTP